MSLANDLLELARDLLRPANRPERRGRPKQVRLRRSISTAYYSLFALLAEEAAIMMVGAGNENKALRGYVMRAISHETIRSVCQGFASKNPNSKIKKVLGSHEIPDKLADIARTCHNLQTYRHEADYNFVDSFKKDMNEEVEKENENATDIFEQAEKAHEKWTSIKKHKATKVFLAALIVHKLVQQSGTIIGTPSKK